MLLLQVQLNAVDICLAYESLIVWSSITLPVCSSHLVQGRVRARCFDQGEALQG